jgi:ubiquinone/menaquinone biosynthesis C-methylase UbiE
MPGRAEQVREFYDATAVASPHFSLMNYGFAPESTGVSAQEDEPEFYCLQLYRQLLRDTDLQGVRVLEVSCGRGGGTNFVKETYKPRVVYGLDLSERSIELARRRFGGIDGLQFEVGNAEKLPYADRVFDAVINVEASHLYDKCETFYYEVRRVLEAGGLFFYADLFESGYESVSPLEHSGFTVLACDDITANVLEALRRDSARRERIIEETIEPDMWEEYKHWSGIRDYRAYNHFRHGDWVYLSYLLKRRS